MARMHDDEGRFIYGWTLDRQPIVDVYEFERLLSDMNARRIGYEVVGDARVSTVHLVMDWGFHTEEAPPLMFETMVGKPLSDGTAYTDHWRYYTREAAEAGHAAILAWVESGMNSAARPEVESGYTR